MPPGAQVYKSNSHASMAAWLVARGNEYDSVYTAYLLKILCANVNAGFTLYTSSNIPLNGAYCQ